MKYYENQVLVATGKRAHIFEGVSRLRHQHKLTLRLIAHVGVDRFLCVWADGTNVKYPIGFLDRHFIPAYNED